MLVLDANILIRAVLGSRVRSLLEEYSKRSIRFFAPDVAFDDAKEYLPSLLNRKGLQSSDADPAVEYLETLVETVPPETYSNFEEEARKRLNGRDEEDWPVLATALALQCAIWTEDQDFFGTGAPVWTTNRVEIYLMAEADAIETERESS